MGVRNDLPRIFHEAGLDIAGVIDEDVDVSMDCKSFFNDLVKSLLVGGHVKIQGRCSKIVEMPQALGASTARSNRPVSTLENRLHKLVTEARRTAGDQPSQSSHRECRSETRDTQKMGIYRQKLQSREMRMLLLLSCFVIGGIVCNLGD